MWPECPLRASGHIRLRADPASAILSAGLRLQEEHMQQDQWLQFQDISTPVTIRGCDDLPAVISRIMRTWTFTVSAQAARAATRSIAIERMPDRYCMTSPWLKQTLQRRDPVDLVCALVIELIWAYLEDHPSSLCLHGAAAEFAGRLVVFPNRYRAGKSLLTGCLARAGHRVFTDDILPVEPIGGDAVISGRATGIAPRLRLPLPPSLRADTISFLDIRAGPQSARYRYLDLPDALQAPRNATLPVGAFVVIDRQAGVAPALTPLGSAEMLRSVVWQNFARAMPSGKILHTLHSLVSAAERYRLVYDQPEPAIEMLQQLFAGWTSAVAKVSEYRPPATAAAEAPPTPAANGAVLYRQRPGVFAHTADGHSFLADAEGVAIHHLNETAATIWNVMASPMSLPQVVQLFQSAFPDQPSDRLADDVCNLFQGLRQKNLLEPVRTTPRGSRPL